MDWINDQYSTTGGHDFLETTCRVDQVTRGMRRNYQPNTPCIAEYTGDSRVRRLVVRDQEIAEASLGHLPQPTDDGDCAR